MRGPMWAIWVSGFLIGSGVVLVLGSIVVLR